MKRKTVWIAELRSGEKRFETKKEAVAAEEEDKLAAEVDRLQPVLEKYFRTYYGDSDRYNNYRYVCVDCGSLLIEWDRVWDGHRNERGRVLEKYDYCGLFGGLRCPSCHDKAKKLLKDMEEAYFRETGNVIMIDVSDWWHYRTHENRSKVSLLKLIQFWDQNKAKIKK